MGSDIDTNQFNDNFGLSVDLSDNGQTLVVGSRGHDTDSYISETGAIYIYEYDSTNNRWIEKGDHIVVLLLQYK